MPLLALFLFFAALVVPPILANRNGTEQAKDMLTAHLPQVNSLLEQPLSLVAYEPFAATTPGQHAVLAWLARAFGYEHVEAAALPIRFANAAFGFLLIWLAWRMLTRRGLAGWPAAALVAPLAGSSYVIAAAVWINTDDGAFVFYLLALQIATAWYSPPTADTGTSGPRLRLALGALLVASCLVLWRQMYLPVAGLLGLCWLIWDRRLRNLPVPALASLVPSLILVRYYLEWHGLTPPVFQGFNGFGIQVAGPLSALALIGLFAPFYLLLFREGLGLFRSNLRWVLAALGVVLLLWLAGPSEHNVAGGRWGGVLWAVAQRSPVFMSRSLVVLGAAWLGAMMVVLWTLLARARHERPFELLALALYVVGYCMQIEAFQRYLEPHVLFTYAFAVTRVRSVPTRWLIGPCILAIAMALATTLRAFDLMPRMLH